MSLKDEIVKIQEKHKITRIEDTTQFKYIIECIDRDLKNYAEECPKDTQRIYRVHGFEFNVSEGKTDYLPGELGYVKVPNTYFKALSEHYEKEGFRCSGTYDRSYGNGTFIIEWN